MSALDDAAERRIVELSDDITDYAPQAPPEALVLKRLRQAWLEGAAAERARVREWKKHNPLGGPARDFEAMASRIRAGEPLRSVLDDFRYALADDVAAEQEACAKVLELSNAQLLLIAGEMTPGELRTVKAVLKNRAVEIRARSGEHE